MTEPPCAIHPGFPAKSCPHCLAARQTAARSELTAGQCACCGRSQSADARGEDAGEDAFSWTWRVIAPAGLFAFGLAASALFAASAAAYIHAGAMLTAYLLSGFPVLREAVEAVRKGDVFNEFSLMSLATLAALGLGEVSEAAGVMLFFSLGEAAQDHAAGRSRRSIRALLASKPEKANLLRDGRIIEADPETIAAGSRIVVKPGDKIPLDGRVLSGTASLDMSPLTGESIPAEAEAGSAVYSGAICLDGDLVLETTAVFSESTVGRILALVENAAAAKSRTERFITVFARSYTPAVAAASVLIAVAPPLLFGASWREWLYRALVLLILSCPCALILSIPLAFLAGIGAAARQDILVKGGQVFDALARATAVVFDKTGTLTRGKLAIAAIVPVPGTTREEVLRLAAIGETRSNHPAAKAILEAAEAEGLPVHMETATRDIAGKGIEAHAPLGEILVGNARLLAERGVAFDPPATNDLTVLVAHNGVFRGGIVLTDTLKPDSARALADLRREGVSGLHMLTGDRPETAGTVAAALGLDSFRAGLLPGDKAAAFRELSPAGDAVFVGDGVNDAPVIALAGVGVAMGALGAGAAVEAADAVILDDSPSRLPILFRIARKTRRVAGQNIVLALGVKAAVMALGVAGLSGLWEAVFADVGVALLAVLNSMRMTDMKITQN